MNLIGHTSDGQMIVKVDPKAIVKVDEALREALMMVGTIRMAVMAERLEQKANDLGTTGQPAAAAAPAPRTTRRPRAVQDRKPAARAPAGGKIYHRCEQCDAKLPDDAAPQKKFCDACVKARKNNCPSMQKRKAKDTVSAKPGKRVAKCEGCGKDFETPQFGPKAHHCPECRKARNAESRKGTAAPRALRKDSGQAPALRRPAMPTDDTGKAARLEQIKRLALKDAQELQDDVIGGVEA